MAFGDLTTLTDVKGWLQTGQAAFPASEDALLTRLITASSQYIQTWLNRQIASADYLEMRDGAGGDRLQLACFPVTAVLSLTIDGQVIPAATSSGMAGYSFSATQLSLSGYCFNRGAQNVVVSYTAGYSTTPPELAQACIELVALRYRERTRIGEVSRSLGGAETVTYAQKDMSDATKTLLQQYRLVAPIATIQPVPEAAGGGAAPV
ncbi:MAG: phage head-tail connector protein [Alphaproteobacteria bacterium]|nr:phage head-tail connector protein [Alphaproteobacteria bacterium]